jgi:hypothetical protein
MALCVKCKAFAVYGAVLSLSGQNLTGDQPSSCSISDWYAHLKDVHESSGSCDLCAIVMKGWREHRPAIIEWNLQNAAFNPETPPEDLYDDVATIGAYRDGLVEVEVVRNDRPDDGRHKVQFLLNIGCRASVSASWDAHDPLYARFRIADPGSSLCRILRELCH